MAKLAEINFIRFENDIPIEEISNTTLSGTVTTPPTIVNPLPGFNVRPGVKILIDNVNTRYNWPGATSIADPLRLDESTYTQRSFVFWFYTSTTSHEGDDNQLFGTPNMGNGRFIRNGVGLKNNNNVILKVDFTLEYTSSNIGTGWHSIIITCDRATPETVLYIDGSAVYSGAVSFPTATQDFQFTSNSSSAEAEFSMGYYATHDVIFNSEQASDIHDAFIADSLQPFPFSSLYGIIRDNNGDRLEGANVIVYDHVNRKVVDDIITGVGGYYNIGIPAPGEYSLYTTKSGTAGGRASSFTVTSGGDITILDDL